MRSCSSNPAMRENSRVHKRGTSEHLVFTMWTVGFMPGRYSGDTDVTSTRYPYVTCLILRRTPGTSHRRGSGAVEDGSRAGRGGRAVPPDRAGRNCCGGAYSVDLGGISGALVLAVGFLGILWPWNW